MDICPAYFGIIICDLFTFGDTFGRCWRYVEGLCRLGPLVAPLGCLVALLSEFMLIYVDLVVHVGSHVSFKINDFLMCFRDRFWDRFFFDFSSMLEVILELFGIRKRL